VSWVRAAARAAVPSAPVRADLTIAVDIATRTICAAVLRPVGKGGRRGVTARANVGARTDTAGMVDGAADVGVAAASLKAGRDLVAAVSARTRAFAAHTVSASLGRRVTTSTRCETPDTLATVLMK
jgi:hypothetical protein